MDDAIGSVPLVSAVMSTENSSEPDSGVAKVSLLMRMYFRWSKTDWSAAVVNVVASTVTELGPTVRVPSPGPYDAVHKAS